MNYSFDEFKETLCQQEKPYEISFFQRLSLPREARKAIKSVVKGENCIFSFRDSLRRRINSVEVIEEPDLAWFISIIMEKKGEDWIDRCYTTSLERYTTAIERLNKVLESNNNRKDLLAQLSETTIIGREVVRAEHEYLRELMEKYP